MITAGIPMTPDEMIAAWDALQDAGHEVTIEAFFTAGFRGYRCWIITYDAKFYKTAEYESRGKRPLQAFEAAYRQYQEAQKP